MNVKQEEAKVGSEPWEDEKLSMKLKKEYLIPRVLLPIFQLGTPTYFLLGILLH